MNCVRCVLKDEEIATLKAQLGHLEDVDRRRFARVLEEEQAARLRDMVNFAQQPHEFRIVIRELLEVLVGDKRLFREPPQRGR